MINKIKNNQVKLSIAVAASISVVILALNSYTVVQAGTTKVQTTFGTVNQTAYGEGLHFPVNPLSSFDAMDTRNAKYEVNDLTIPTQDRFNSTGNVTVLYRIDGKKTPYIKQNFGTADEYIDKSLRQHLRSIIRDEGRKISDSRGLAQSNSITIMQDNAKRRLSAALDGAGVDIQEVLIQSIKFDPRIAQQILDTQKRIQLEEQKKSQERITITEAEINKQVAIGAASVKREATDAEAYRVTQEAQAKKLAVIAVAEGNKQAAIAEAQGESEAIKLVADANLKLTKSLTPQILEKYRLENEAVLYSKSVGNVPNTIIGETDLRAIGVPMAAIK